MVGPRHPSLLVLARRRPRWLSAVALILFGVALGAGERPANDGPMAWTSPVQVPAPQPAASDADTDARWSWYLDHTPAWRLAADAPATAMVVTWTLPVSPADKAGLGMGDQVVTLGDRRPPSGRLPQLARPVSVTVRSRSGGERTIPLPVGDIGATVHEWPSYDAPWRRASGRPPAAAAEAMQVAASAIFDEPQIAATALARATKAGAKGPYVHALQATIAVSLGRYDEAMAAATAAVAKLPPEECGLLHGVVRDAALRSMRLPFYQAWLKKYPALRGNAPDVFPEIPPWDAADLRDAGQWLTEPLLAGQTLPRSDLVPLLQAGAKQSWVGELRDKRVCGWRESPGGRFLKGSIMPPTADFRLTFNFPLVVQTRRSVGWRRYASLDFANAKRQYDLRWAIDLSDNVSQYLEVAGMGRLQLQTPFYTDGRPNRMEFAAHRGLLQVRINDHPILLAVRRPQTIEPHAAELFTEGVAWRITDLVCERLGGKPGADAVPPPGGTGQPPGDF